MKKACIFVCALIAVCISVAATIASCAMPETVAIKTDATYSLEFGMKSVDLSETMNVSAVSDLFPKDSGMAAYAYNPDGKSEVRHFLIEFAPIKDMPLDISAAIKSLAFGQKIGEAMSFDEKIYVPKTGLNQSFTLPVAAHGTNKLPVNNITLSIEKSDNLISAQIGEGNLVLSVRRPSGWSGVTATPNFSLSGGVNANAQDFVTEPRDGYILYTTLNLRGKTFKPENIVLSGEIELSGNAPSASTALDVAMQVNKFESATVNLGDLKTSLNYSENVPDELRNFIKSIEYNAAGISFKYKNTLPQGNNISIKTSSAFLGMTNATANLEATLAAEAKNGKLEEKDKQIEIKPSSENQKIDFDVTLNFPGSQTVGGKTHITVRNIEAGKEYVLSLGDFAFDIDWEAITINGSRLSVPSGEIDLPIDIANLFSGMTKEMEGMGDLVAAIQFPDIPVYMYMSKPAGIDLGTVHGKFVMNSKKDGETVSVSDELFNGDIIMTDKTLSLSRESTVVVNLEKLDYLTKLDKKIFSKILNEKRKDLKLAYEMNIGGGNGTRITKKDLDALKANGGAVSVKAAIFIDIPLEMFMGKTVGVDLMKFVGDNSKTDLLGRENAQSENEMAKYLAAIKSIGMNLETTNTIFRENEKKEAIGIVIEDKILGKKRVDFKTFKLDFTGKQIADIIKSEPPYMPNITIELPQGSGFSIPTEALLSFAGKVTVETDGTITILGGSDK